MLVLELAVEVLGRHLELLVERARLLADLEHLLAAPGNSPVSSSGCVKPAPSSICSRAIVELLAVDDVAEPPRSSSASPRARRHLPGACVEHAAEALEDRVLDDALDDRDLERHVAARSALPLGASTGTSTRPRRTTGADRGDVPEIGEEVERRTASSASAAGDRRQLLEQRLELGST